MKFGGRIFNSGIWNGPEASQFFPVPVVDYDAFSGLINVVPRLTGSISTAPRFTGIVEVRPRFSGSIKILPS